MAPQLAAAYAEIDLLTAYVKQRNKSGKSYNHYVLAGDFNVAPGQDQQPTPMRKSGKQKTNVFAGLTELGFTACNLAPTNISLRYPLDLPFVGQVRDNFFVHTDFNSLVKPEDGANQAAHVFQFDRLLLKQACKKFPPDWWLHKGLLREKEGSAGAALSYVGGLFDHLFTFIDLK